jgi:phosphoribosylformylglycinamidine synthase I
MTIAIPCFPATNNEYDVRDVLQNFFNTKAIIIPHFKREKLFDSSIQGIIIPGGFSYGDSLRAGAIAAVSEMIDNLKQRIYENSIPVLGICNGFQILTEAGLLPGALLQNISTRFVCKWTFLKLSSSNNPLTKNISKKILMLPIAHYEGRYYQKKEELEQMESKNQILLQYVNEEGNITPDANPNGSLLNIACVCDESQQIFGMMPHPERASKYDLTSKDGLFLLNNFLKLIDGCN